ncbi:single-stranded DNA-binding protein [Lactococcus allomyrinae]|uniref:single-stranded DNA-binding protein n=1 Tax=Lactococcus allomyrinae TaxID=2419773 RepID=UPI001F0900C5|nr:single-stranded DNA-binding protein [Lactococcus allomyrinae]
MSTFLPPFVHEGMTVTVSGTVKKEVKGEYTNYSIQYPVIDTVYQPKTPEQQETSSTGMWTPGGGALPDTSDNIGYYGSSPTEIADSDLPF